MPEYLLMIAFALVAAFYGGAETGLYCVNRIRLRLRLEQGWPGASALRWLVERPQLSIATILVGHNIGVYCVTVLCMRKLQEMGFGVRAELYTIFMLPPVLLVFVEILPKMLYQRRADTFMYHSAWPLAFSGGAFYPLTFFLQLLGRIPQLFFRRGATLLQDVFTVERFRFFLSEGSEQGALSPYQRSMAENILRLKNQRVERIMTPLAETVMVSDDQGLADLRQVLARQRFSRIPLYTAERTQVKGVINILDVVSAGRNTVSLRALARPVHRVDWDMNVAEALRSLQQAKEQFAVVSGPDGRAVGIVTVKDLVEEIVGELAAW